MVSGTAMVQKIITAPKASHSQTMNYITTFDIMPPFKFRPQCQIKSDRDSMVFRLNIVQYILAPRWPASVPGKFAGRPTPPRGDPQNSETSPG